MLQFKHKPDQDVVSYMNVSLKVFPTYYGYFFLSIFIVILVVARSMIADNRSLA